MNPVLFRTLFGGLFLFKIAVKTGLDLLNWSHIRQNAANIPGSLQNLVTPAEIARINDYNIAKIRFRLIFSLFNSLLLLVFFFSPLYPGFTGWIAALPAAFIFKGLAFFLILGFCGWILDLPFNFFYHFRIEAAFGFNKYSIAGWFKDELKTLAIGSVLTIVILSIIFSIWADPFSFRWGYVFLGWSIALVLVVLFMYLVPLILIPLFYKLTPLEDQDLGEKIAGLFQRSGLKVRGIFQADESSKSTHANAMIAGFGRSKTIILFDTLVNNYSREEIAAIIAHEIGHGKRRHIFQLMALTIGELFLFILFASYLLGTGFPYQAMGIGKILYSGAFLSYVLFFDLLTFFTAPLISAVSRAFEYQADKFAKDLTGSGAPLISSFEKLIGNELGNLNPHPLYEVFYYSHPTLIKRIEALK